MAAGVGPGDAVITCPNTFIATTEAISQVGAVPVFVDVDPSTFTMDPQKLESLLDNRHPKTHSPANSSSIKLTSNTKADANNALPPCALHLAPRAKALIPIHLYGQAADMDPILDIAREYNLAVIEDACQAHGTLYKGRKAGSMGASGCFSFYPGKNLGAFGEAGAVTTNDETVAAKIRMIRDHGQKQKYIHDMEGYNGRLDALQAAVLRVKLKRLKDWNEARRKNAALYRRYLSGIPGVTLVREAEYGTPVYHLFVIFVDDRDGLQEHLQQRGVATGLHYPVPLHLQKAYAHMGHRTGDFPVSESAALRLLSLPMYPELTEEQIAYVAGCIKQFMETAAP